MKKWKEQFTAELNAAENARAQSNEGRARVCARRAVGLLLSAYFAVQGIDYQRPSAYDKLRFFATLPDIPEEIRQVAQHFLVRVTPEFALPVDVDLIADAKWLCTRLFPSED